MENNTNNELPAEIIEMLASLTLAQPMLAAARALLETASTLLEIGKIDEALQVLNIANSMTETAHSLMA